MLRRFLGFFSFLSLARIKKCVPTSFDKKSTHHRDFLRYSWAVAVILSQAGWTRYIVSCINLAFTKMIDGTEKPKIRSKFAKRAAQYNKLHCKGLTKCVCLYLCLQVNCKTFFVLILNGICLFALNIRVKTLRENYSCNYKHQLKRL